MRSSGAGTQSKIAGERRPSNLPKTCMGGWIWILRQHENLARIPANLVAVHKFTVTDPHTCMTLLFPYSAVYVLLQGPRGKYYKLRSKFPLSILFFHDLWQYLPILDYDITCCSKHQHEWFLLPLTPFTASELVIQYLLTRPAVNIAVNKIDI